ATSDAAKVIVSLLPKAEEVLICAASPAESARPRAAVAFPPALTSSTASRRVKTASSVVLSAALLTTRAAGARRSSRASTRSRGGVAGRVRGGRANRERIQVRAVMGISSRGGVACGTVGGQRPRRADRAPGRCRAGGGVAWRQNPTGRPVSIAYFTRRLAAS